MDIVETVARNLERMTGQKVQPIKIEPFYVFNGKKYKAFEAIPVISLVQRSDRGTLYLKKGKEAQVSVMPRHGGKASLYLEPKGMNLCCESDAKEGVHFKWID